MGEIGDTVKEALAGLRTLASSPEILKNAQANLRIAEVVRKVIALEERSVQEDAEIRRLKEVLAIRPTLVRVGDAYFEKDKDGKATGAPICSPCWEADYRVFHLIMPAKDHRVRVCGVCKNQVHHRLATPTPTVFEPGVVA